VTRALVGAGSTCASLTFVSGEALAFTSGSVACSLTSTLDNVVGTVSIPLTEISSSSGVSNRGSRVGLKGLRVDSTSTSSNSRGNRLIGGNGELGSSIVGNTLDGVEAGEAVIRVSDSNLGTSAEGRVGTQISCGGDGDGIVSTSDSSGDSPASTQTIRSSSREGVSLGASSLGAISTSPGSILIGSGILTDVVSTSGTSIGVASAGILRAALTMSRAEVGAVGRDGGNCSSDDSVSQKQP